jgi:hypothetical protein
MKEQKTKHIKATAKTISLVSSLDIWPVNIGMPIPIVEKISLKIICNLRNLYEYARLITVPIKTNSDTEYMII